MTSNPGIRRLFVVLAVTGSLLVAGFTVRAASLWAASQAPLTVAPVSVSSVQQALEAERGRSAALETQLKTLESSTSDLTAALAAAQAQVGADEQTATELRASLAAAQARLVKLEASLKAAAARATTRSTTSTGTTSGTTSGGGDDDDDEHDDD
jgi:septal ring factor EnvC (AmiA/AmiB activator)